MMMMLISQDYFDEICVENYELLFDDDDNYDDDKNGSSNKNDEEEDNNARMKETNNNNNNNKNEQDNDNNPNLVVVVAHGDDDTSTITSISKNKRKKEVETVQETIEQLLKQQQQQQNQSNINTNNQSDPNNDFALITLLFSHLTTSYPNSRLGKSSRSERIIFLNNLQVVAQALQHLPSSLSSAIPSSLSSTTTTMAMEHIYQKILEDKKNDFIMYRSMFWKYDGFHIYWSFLERLTTPLLSHDCAIQSRKDTTENEENRSNNNDSILSLTLSTMCTLLTTTASSSTAENNANNDDNVDDDDDNDKEIVGLRQQYSTDNRTSRHSNKSEYLVLRNEFMYAYQKATSTERVGSTWLVLYHTIFQQQQQQQWMDNQTIMTATKTMTIPSQSSSSLLLILQQLLQLGYMSCQKSEENKRIWMMTTTKHVTTTTTTTLSLPDILTTSFSYYRNEIESRIVVVVDKQSCTDDSTTTTSILNNNSIATTTTTTNSSSSIEETLKEMDETVNNRMDRYNDDDWMLHCYDICARICRLITVLCTFEYATTASRMNHSSGNPTTVESSSSAAVVVQSSHKHTIQFQEAGTVPTLYRLVTVALQLLSTTTTTTSKRQEINTRSRKNNKIAKTLAMAIGTARSLAIQDEIIKEMDAIGFVQKVYDVLVYCFQQQQQQPNNCDNDTDMEEGSDHATTTTSIVLSVVGLLRNFVLNDAMKHKLLSFHNNNSIQNQNNNNNNDSSNRHSIPLYIRDIMIRYKLATKKNRHIKEDRHQEHQQQQESCNNNHYAIIQEHCIGWIAGMSLRCHSQVAELFVQQYRIHINIMDAMIHHPYRASLHRQAALAIRNLASRCEPIIKTILSTASVQGSTIITLSDNTNKNNNNENNRTYTIEEIFHTITIPYHRTCHDEVYSALRDLGGMDSVPSLSYHIIEQDRQTGEIVSVQKNRSMFGDGSNANFRPVYE